MASARTYEDEVFRKKRIPKNPIKFNIQLNEEQKIAKEQILTNTVTILAGKAGSGKTLLACQVALDGLFRRQYEKIIITRPTVSKEEIGFLPGDLHQKMDPWVQPIYQNMYTLYGKERVDPFIKDGKIEIVPVAFMRGSRDSGFRFLYNLGNKIKNFVSITLLKNHRDPIVDDLINAYEEFYDKKKNK